MTTDAKGLSADPLHILLEHNRWATKRVLTFCEELSETQFNERFDIGPGSLNNTLTHIVGAMRRWADRIDGRPLRPTIEVPEGSTWTFFGGPEQGPRPEVPRRSPKELKRLLDEAAVDLRAVADRCVQRGLATVFVVNFGSKVYHFTYGAALTHVTTHGMHHRAQCLNMLRRLNAPCMSRQDVEIGVIDWQAEVETGELSVQR